MKKTLVPVLTITIGGLMFAGGCGDDDDADDQRRRGEEQTGQACDLASDCYKNIDITLLQGTVECVERVRDGYCTHSCESTDNCCAVDGECKTGLTQVCAPFESEPGRKCFISCAGQANEAEFCQREAGTDFICRASGGGDPQKICVPDTCGTGASCNDAYPCDQGLTCLTAFRGGYCGIEQCTSDEGCPDGTRCVTHANGTNYCLRVCTSATDCSFCRPASEATECRPDASFVTAGAADSVCVPVVR